MKLLIIVCVVLFLQSCGSTSEMVKYTPKQREVFTNENLKRFLSSNPKTNIVLRVPNIREEVTTKRTDDKTISTNDNNNDMDIYFNAIEKEFLKAGFSVRDRGLFNEVLGGTKDGKQLDYSQIKEFTNTDLIIEVVRINPAIKYQTNTTYTVNKKGESKNKVTENSYSKYGASTEFKIIMVKNNEMAGTYTFNYAPCVEGCTLNTFKSNPFANIKIKGTQVAAYQGVEKNIMEEFIRKSTQDLINAMKN